MTKLPIKYIQLRNIWTSAINLGDILMQSCKLLEDANEMKNFLPTPAYTLPPLPPPPLPPLPDLDVEHGGQHLCDEGGKGSS